LLTSSILPGYNLAGQTRRSAPAAEMIGEINTGQTHRFAPTTGMKGKMDTGQTRRSAPADGMIRKINTGKYMCAVTALKIKLYKIQCTLIKILEPHY